MSVDDGPTPREDRFWEPLLNNERLGREISSCWLRDGCLERNFRLHGLPIHPGASMEGVAARCRTRGSRSQSREKQEPPYALSSLEPQGRLRRRPT
jgi:hypothetical protein